MISETAKQNWVETALRHWEELKVQGEITSKHKPNRPLLGNLITFLFSNEQMLKSHKEWTDLSAITAENFYEPESVSLILKSLSDRVGWGENQRKAAYTALKAAYEERFDIDTPLPKHSLSAPDHHVKKTRKPSRQQPSTLAEIWEDVAFKVLKSELKIPAKHQPGKEAVQEVIQDVFTHLQKRFGEVSHARFLGDDDVIDATDDYLDQIIEQTDAADRKLIAEVLKVASNQLPSPKR